MAWQQNFLNFQYTPNANARCIVHGIAVGTSAIMALPVAVRGAVFFHNPGSIPLWVYQGLSALGAPQTLAPGAPGTFILNPGIALELNPCGTGAWYAVALNAGGALTVTEF